MTTRLLAILVASVVLGLAPAARACNVPVFRYALERWAPHKFEVLVFHDGSLSTRDKALVAELAKVAEEDQNANITLELVNLEKQPEKEFVALYRKLQRKDLPLVVVRFPSSTQIPEPVHVGPLSKDTIQAVLHSPLRTELARRLLKGDSAVWVLLESGDRTKDDATAQLVQEELKKLEREMKLPELTDDPEDRLKSATPLRLAFSLLRLSRTDPKEKVLVQMLLQSEEDLVKETAPILFPVFGRGRALWALIGAGITSKNLTEASLYLTGPCTCKIKEQNPGVDLLISTDWEAGLERLSRAVQDRALPPLSGLAPVALPGLPKGGATALTAVALVRSQEESTEPVSWAKQNGPPEVPGSGSVADSILQSRLPDCCCCDSPPRETPVTSGGCVICNVSLAVGVGLLAVAGLALFMRRSRRTQ